MKILLITILALITISCSPSVVLEDAPLGYSIMPEYLELDSVYKLRGDDTNSVVDDSYTDFKSLSLDSGIYISRYGDTVVIPGGVLISDRKAALYVYYKGSWERYRIEHYFLNKLMREYYDKAVASEALYQQEIDRLKKKSRRSWFERNLGYIGFGCGLLVGVVNSALLLQFAN